MVHLSVLIGTAALLSAGADGYGIRGLDVGDVKVTGGFWLPRVETNRVVTIPSDFRKCEETGRIANFEKAGRRENGGFQGFRFDDSDVFKVMEGAAYSLAQRPDAALDAYLDGLVAKVAAAQEPDGYLYTARTLGAVDWRTGTNRWSNLSISHELYNVGHLYEAAVAHYRATGKKTLLDVATRNADLLTRTFGLGPGQVRDIPGHEEIEIGLVKLYQVTGKAAYLDLARLFVDLRGRRDLRTKDLYGKSHQDHERVTNQCEAVGHAVRAGYLYCGLADLAAETRNADYLRAVDRLWENVVGRKLHLTGGIGARPTGEAFGDDYELPNRSAYLETCASIANGLWNYRMFRLHGDAKYLDVLERVLYNGFLSGVSVCGDEFFYPNPLAANAGRCRQKWFGCSCCPVNVARFMPQIGAMAYAQRENAAYCNLFVESEVTLGLPSGNVRLSQKTEYPWQGEAVLTVEPERDGQTFDLFVRRPGWSVGKPAPSDLYRQVEPSDASGFAVEVNGKAVAATIEKGFAVLRRPWRKGDRVRVRMDMRPRKVVASEMVADDCGRMAFERGPIVFCSEAVDNGGSVLDKIVDAAAGIAVGETEIAGVRVPTLRVAGQKVRATGLAARAGSPCDIVLVPYAFWCHRGSGEMQVWHGVEPSRADIRPPLTASVSHHWKSDGPAAMCDGIRPLTSHENSPRMTFWPHRGTREWAQYDLASAEMVSGFRICWYDDGTSGHCRVPANCRILVKSSDPEEWRAIKAACPLVKDAFSELTFPEPVLLKAIRLDIGLQPNESGGILEWELIPGGTPPKHIPTVDISKDTGRQTIIEPGTEKVYQGHPTTVVADDGTLLCVWTIGHGGKCGPMAKSTDGGKTWTRCDGIMPAQYREFANCPTLQRIPRKDGGTNLAVFSAAKGGCGIVISEDNGKTWKVAPIASLSAGMPPTGLLPLKDGTVALFGQVFKSKERSKDRPDDDQAVWMSQSSDGGWTWSPMRTVAAASERNLCEPFALRSPDGRELCLLMRENRHQGRSMMCFSRDEGKTWTSPVDTPWGLTGDRHEGVALPDGRWVIAFRDRAIGSETYGQFVAWVGTYDDIRNGRPGQYRIHLLQHYGKRWAAVDTGYSGMELMKDGSILCTTYSKHSDDNRLSSVVSTRFRIEETDRLARK